LTHGGIDYFVAALRECFEEAGLLYATDVQGRLLQGAEADALAHWRAPLQRGERSLAALCQEHRLSLPLDRFAYLSHWVTPVGRAKRFDTRFFLAVAPPGQTALHDDGELVEQRWLRPAHALAEGTALRLMTPTLKTLETLAAFSDTTALMAWARSPRDIVRWEPRLGTDATGMRPVTPDEPAWVELGRLDPQGRGHVACAIQPGAPVRLSAHVIRVTAANPGVMTGPGTNSYLVGGGPRNEWAVIDPGPADDRHLAALMAAAPGPIRWIFATHTHLDHSPACALLRAATGAPVLGRVADHASAQDPSFLPDELLGGGERMALDDGVSLRVVHTPGHASNHLCYLLEDEKTLFTGDHVMQRSTVVINPPDGDMAAYLVSLQSLCRLELDWLAPGHGFLMDQPHRVFEALIAHRLRREAKVLATLQAWPDVAPERLLPLVYDDVPERMHPIALRSLHAHLRKLRDEGQAIEQQERWSVRAGKDR
jgi:glyoxylase-like metal-dependent hydrolase (beta-lactamase superfamily II)/8-oxo-dGTP pyrophosphatase MutT (NUDIX family)